MDFFSWGVSFYGDTIQQQHITVLFLLNQSQKNNKQMFRTWFAAWHHSHVLPSSQHLQKCNLLLSIKWVMCHKLSTVAASLHSLAFSSISLTERDEWLPSFVEQWHLSASYKIFLPNTNKQSWRKGWLNREERKKEWPEKLTNDYGAVNSFALSKWNWYVPQDIFTSGLEVWKQKKKTNKPAFLPSVPCGSHFNLLFVEGFCCSKM